MRLPTLLPGLLLLTCGAFGCSDLGGKSCHAVGCTSGVTYAATLTVPRPESDLLAVTACRNAVCGTTLIQLGKGSYTLTRPESGPAVTSFDLRSETGPQPVGFTVGGETAEMRNGDVYHLTIEDQTSKTTLLDVTTEPATYTRYQPNGADCDGDFYCASAALKGR